MTNLLKKEDAKVASLPLEDPVEPVVVKEPRYVMLYNELTPEELEQLKGHFDVYVFDKADFKLTIKSVLDDCELLLIDVNEKDNVYWWSEQRPRIDEEAFPYSCKLLYKARKGNKINIAKLKALYSVETVLKYIPDTYIKANVEFIRRLCVDHIPESEGGCGLFSCLKKSQ